MYTLSRSALLGLILGFSIPAQAAAPAGARWPWPRRGGPEKPRILPEREGINGHLPTETEVLAPPAGVEPTTLECTGERRQWR